MFWYVLYSLDGVIEEINIQYTGSRITNATTIVNAHLNTNDNFLFVFALITFSLLNQTFGLLSAAECLTLPLQIGRAHV